MPPAKSAAGRPENDSLWSRLSKLIYTIILAVVGFIGYEGMWPKVTIEASSAVDSGMLAYQFTFSNHPYYPVKIKSVTVYVIDLKMPFLPKPGQFDEFDHVKLIANYNTNNICIAGNDSITLKMNTSFRFANVGRVESGSRIIVKVTYELPVIKIRKSDYEALEAGSAIDNSLIWTKKPLQVLPKDKDFITFQHIGDNEI